MTIPLDPNQTASLEELLMSQVVQQEDCLWTKEYSPRGFLGDSKGDGRGDKGEKGCEHDPTTKARKGHKDEEIPQ